MDETAGDYPITDISPKLHYLPGNGCARSDRSGGEETYPRLDFSRITEKMSISLNIRSIESPEATEIYISVSPGQEMPLEVQAREIFSGIREILRSKKAYIFQERVLYCTPDYK